MIPGPKPKRLAPKRGRPCGSRTRLEKRIEDDAYLEERACYLAKIFGLNPSSAAQHAVTERFRVVMTFANVKLPNDSLDGFVVRQRILNRMNSHITDCL